MIFLDFNPNDSQFRLFYIILYFLVFFYIVQLVSTFISNYNKNKAEPKSIVYFGLIALFSGLGIMELFYSLVFFFNVNIPDYRKISNIILLISLFLFILISELRYFKQYKKKTRLLYLVMSIFMLVYYFGYFDSDIYLIESIGYGFLMIYPFIFIQNLKKMAAINTKKRIYLFFLSLILSYIALIIENPIFLTLFPYEILYAVGRLILPISIKLIQISFYNLDIFTELGWQEHLESIYVIKKENHQPIYYLDFKTLLLDKDQYSKTLKSNKMNAWVDDFQESKELHKIEKEFKKEFQDSIKKKEEEKQLDEFLVGKKGDNDDFENFTSKENIDLNFKKYMIKKEATTTIEEMKKQTEIPQKQENTEEIAQKQQLISGGLVGIEDLTKKIADSVENDSGIKLIEQEGKYLLIEKGRRYIVCFVADKNMSALRQYLKKILESFEFYYTDSLSFDYMSLSSEEISNEEKIKVQKIMDSIIKSTLDVVAF